MGRYRVGRLAVAVASVVVLGGCALGPQSLQGRVMQGAITGVVVVDTLQTITIARSPECLMEANPVAFLGDDSPSEKEVIAHNLVYLVGHWLLGGWLDRKANGNVKLTLNERGGWDEGMETRKWKFVQRMYWGLTLGGHGAAVKGNKDTGIGLATEKRCGR